MSCLTQLKNQLWTDNEFWHTESLCMWCMLIQGLEGFLLKKLRKDGPEHIWGFKLSGVHSFLCGVSNVFVVICLATCTSAMTVFVQLRSTYTEAITCTDRCRFMGLEIVGWLSQRSRAGFYWTGGFDRMNFVI